MHPVTVDTVESVRHFTTGPDETAGKKRSPGCRRLRNDSSCDGLRGLIRSGPESSIHLLLGIQGAGSGQALVSFQILQNRGVLVGSGSLIPLFTRWILKNI